MIPVKLILSNFTSYGEKPQSLDFTKFSLAAISGSNGVGKSSILDSITWCVWGTSRAGDSADSLIRLGQIVMFVEFEFELDSHNYLIKRARKLNSTTSLEFYSGKNNLTEGTIKATQQKIIDTLHLSFDTFVNSSYIRQGHADEFTTKGPTDRKKILADILGLSQYDELEEKAKQKAKEIEGNLKLFEYQLLEIEAELSQKESRQAELTQTEAEVREIEKNLKEVEGGIKLVEQERETLSVKQKALLEKQERLKKIVSEISDLKLQISVKERTKEEYQGILLQKDEIEENCLKLSKLQEQKKDLDLKRSAVIKAKDELVNLQKLLNQREEKRQIAISGVQVEIKECQTQIESLEKEVDHLKTHKDQCPTCGQEIDAKKNSEIVTKNEGLIKDKNSQIKELEEKLGKYKTAVLPEQKSVEEKEVEVKKLEEETKDYTEIALQISNLSKYEDLNLKLKEAQSAIKATDEALVDLKKIIITREKEIQTDSEDLKDLKGLEMLLQEVVEKLKAQEIIRTEINQKLSLLQTQLGAAKQLVDRATQLEELYQKKSKESSSLKEEKAIYEELSLAFGKKGIQAMIIETAIPEIEEETNDLLDKLTEGRMKVALETQKETKTKVANGEKGLVETLDIIISDEMGERAYELYSGGEAFRVNFALRLALSKLLTHRAGSKLQFLIIDEGFGTQDSQGIARMVEAINAVKADFAKILVITHLDELKEEFDTRVEVSKGSTGSTFELVGA